MYGRHLIIGGNRGIGKKYLACKLGDYFNEYINKNVDKTQLYIVYCTKMSKMEDLYGNKIMEI